MLVWQAILLGFAQGLAEFLPVSSSGHLELLKALLNIDLNGCELLFDLVLHLGTLVSVLLFYAKRLRLLLKKPFRTAWWLLLATIPAGVAGLFLDEWVEKYCLNGLICGICFLITALLLVLTDKRSEANERRARKELPLSKAVLPMGLSQAFAILPGISRSGATIAAGVFSGVNKEEAADFSFLMSLPIVLGSLALKSAKLLVKEGELSLALSAFGGTKNAVLCLFFGVLSAAVVGYFSILWVLSAVKKGKLKGFSVYLVFVAVLSFFLYAKGLFA